MRLARAGVASVLLKGTAFSTILYDGALDRVSVDCDLFIPPEHRDRATRALRELGFAPLFLASDAPGAQGRHGGSWVRQDDRMLVDLHVNLPETTCTPQEAWDALRPRTVTRQIGGVPTLILDEAGTALLATLHAAHHGPDWLRGVEDVRRAVRIFDTGVWDEARGLAAALGAERPFAEGLELVPEGTELRARLGLAQSRTAQRLLAWRGAPWGAHALEEMASSRGAVQRLVLLVRLLVPTPRSMRLDTPLARRGTRGLAVAYLLRPLRVTVRLPAAARAWRRARRSARY